MRVETEKSRKMVSRRCVFCPGSSDAGMADRRCACQGLDVLGSRSPGIFNAGRKKSVAGKEMDGAGLSGGRILSVEYIRHYGRGCFWAWKRLGQRNK